MCFVNIELQLLYSLPYVREFFCLQNYKENINGKLNVCDETSRIFRTEGRIETTAAELRSIGQFHKRQDMIDGTQKEIEEFHTLLLEVIDDELQKVGWLMSFWS